MTTPPAGAAPNRKQRRAADKAAEKTIDRTAAFQAAVEAHQKGDLASAESLYRKLLAVDPAHVDALHNLGLITLASARASEAADLFQRATRVMPGYPRAYAGLGGAYRELGRLADAEQSLVEAVRLDARDVASLCNLGLVLLSLERPVEAKARFTEALALDPANLQARFHLAAILSAEGQLPAAAEQLGAILKLNPGLPSVWLELGVVHQRLGAVDEGVACYRRALELDPGYTLALYNLASVEQGRGRFADALEGYERLLALAPDHLPGRVNHALALLQLGRPHEALDRYGEALQIAPENADALCGLADTLKVLGRHEEATGVLERAARSRPDSPNIRKALGLALQHDLRMEDAIAQLGEAVRLDPKPLSNWVQLAAAKARAIDWNGLEVCQQAALARIGAPGSGVAAPFALLTMNSSPAQQLASARDWSAEIARGVQPLPARPAHDRQRLRIGYLSADFRHHATALLATGLFEAHDRDSFEVVAYCINPSDGSDDRRRLEAAFDRFVDLTELPHADAAQRIWQDEVDILVDLKGYTGDARPGIVAMRPGAIQVNYLGYPGTMGAHFIDYILVDGVIAPPQSERFFSEAVARVPGSYQPNMKRPISQRSEPRTEHGLPADGFVFCSFNNSYKITPQIFDIWMRLLQAVPGSVLWLLDWNPTATANLTREAAARGVGPERLVFAPPMLSPDHLARHRHADLFLDTLPVCAHTTASDALWAGLPLVSCLGETFVSRVSGSLLAAIGLPELITDTLADYEALALRLARDPAELAALRQRLWAARETSGLYESADIARRLEAVYQQMWARHRAGLPPAAIG